MPVLCPRQRPAPVTDPRFSSWAFSSYQLTESKNCEPDGEENGNGDKLLFGWFKLGNAPHPETAGSFLEYARIKSLI